MFFNLRLRPKVGTFYSLPVSAAPILSLSLFFFRVFLYERPFFSLYNLSNLSIGESLFTLFASLTYAYNYLMTLIKWKLWILKGHNSFSYLWKFEPSTPNGFGQILFKLKLEILQRMHGWYFLIAWKELKITQIAQITQLFQLMHLVHIYGYGFYELSRMLTRKTVNSDVSKDSPIYLCFREKEEAKTIIFSRL